MVDRDYRYVVYPQDLDPYGPAGKENMDVIRLIFDFTCYLEPGEVVQAVQFPTIVVAPTTAFNSANWQTDYLLDCPALMAESPEDLYPLRVVSEAITNLGHNIELRLNAGTPNFTYVVSFVIVASVTRRRKQVDTIINVETLLNARMIGPGDLDPDIVPPIIIDQSTALPMGFDGLVILQNTGSLSNIVITMPPNPVIGQHVEFIDALGSDWGHPVTFRGDGDVPIDGDGSLAFVSTIAFDCLRFVWLGSNWFIQTLRFGFLT